MYPGKVPDCSRGVTESRDRRVFELLPCTTRVTHKIVKGAGTDIPEEQIRQKNVEPLVQSLGGL